VGGRRFSQAGLRHLSLPRQRGDLFFHGFGNRNRTKTFSPAAIYRTMDMVSIICT
jgi:hypothetical protein